MTDPWAYLMTWAIRKPGQIVPVAWDLPLLRAEWSQDLEGIGAVGRTWDEAAAHLARFLEERRKAGLE